MADAFPVLPTSINSCKAGKEEIELKEAYHCWKVVAVLKDKEECLGGFERI